MEVLRISYTICVPWCRRVQGLDATAARTFFSLRSGLERLGVELVLTHMPSTRYTPPQHKQAHPALPTANPAEHAVHSLLFTHCWLEGFVHLHGWDCQRLQA